MFSRAKTPHAYSNLILLPRGGSDIYDIWREGLEWETHVVERDDC